MAKSKSSPAPRLNDIVEAIELVRKEMADVTLEAFEADIRKRWLVERGLEIISEASRHLSSALKAWHTHIPWSKVAGIGNVLRHEYERIAHHVLWRVVRDDLTGLARVCRHELAADRTRERSKPSK